MLAEGTFNVLIGIVMNDSSNGLIKVPEDIPQGTVSIFVNEVLHGRIDVGDGCWQFMLMTSLRYCQYRIGHRLEVLVYDFLHRTSHQHNFSVNKILNLTPSQSHEHNNVINMTVDCFRKYL